MSEIIQKLLEPYKYFIDFEASGLGDDGYPIEVGVAWDGGSFESLITPIEKWTYWNSQAQKTHGISRRKLEKEGRPAIEVAEELNKLFKGQTLWCDSKFDVWWCDVFFEAVGIEQKFEVKNIAKSLPTELWERLLVEVPPRDQVKHRALEDALDLKESWEKVAKKVMRDSSIIKRIEQAVAETA